MWIPFLSNKNQSYYVMKVEIGLLHDLPQAKMVTTEPISADDWEIIVSPQSIGLVNRL